MKRVSKEDVNNVANYMLQLLESKVSALETQHKSQKESLQEIRQECNKAEKALASLGLSKNDENDFQIYESISVGLKALIRSQTSPNQDVEVQEKRPKAFLDQLLSERNGENSEGYQSVTRRGEEREKIESGYGSHTERVYGVSRNTPQKINKVRTEKTPEKNALRASNSFSSMSGRGSSVKKNG